MRCPLKSEFEAASTAYLLGAVRCFFPLSKAAKGYSSTKGKSTIDKLSTAAVFG
ncbi:hypothetical protein T12_16118 [Trichinella patagoniensis]|uniref:Uncharacterized protein n=1 Tax=Trichinella patagoniensis TaxID=990121 RepID=A0A0V0YRI3_9BILA|nr:hypothetical protein T12_16118 [Trichinella patagoniensis]